MARSLCWEILDEVREILKETIYLVEYGISKERKEQVLELRELASKYYETSKEICFKFYWDVSLNKCLCSIRKELKDIDFWLKAMERKKETLIFLSRIGYVDIYGT
jgi:hypothetical protein